MLDAPLVFSSTVAIIAPKMTRNPMDATVLPKPSFRISTIPFSGSAVMASSRETMNNEANALSLVTEVRSTINTILNTTRKEMTRMLMRI